MTLADRMGGRRLEEHELRGGVSATASSVCLFRGRGLSWLRLTAMSAAIGLASAPALAQSTLSTDDPALRSVGFLSIPQVSGRGYILDASLVTRYDSNFRRSTIDDDGSAIRMTPLVEAGIGTLLGRQQVYAGGSVGRDYFLNNSDFNGRRYSFGAGANLVAGTRCTANIGSQYGQRQLLESDAVELADNIQSDFISGAGFNCQGPVGVGFGAIATYRTVRNARDERQLFDANTLTISPQISYASPVLGVFSLGGSLTKVRYPQRPVLTLDGVADDGTDIRSARIGFARDLGTRLQFSVGFSLIDADPKPMQELIPGPLPGTVVISDRQGFDGNGFDASLTAQIGARGIITASADSSVRGAGNVGALLTRSESFGLDASYRLSSSITAGVGGRYNKLRYIGSFASADEPEPRESDTIKRVYAQLDYAPTQRYSIGVEVAYQDRTSVPSIFQFSNTSALLRLNVALGRS